MAKLLALRSTTHPALVPAQGSASMTVNNAPQTSGVRAKSLIASAYVRHVSSAWRVSIEGAAPNDMAASLNTAFSDTANRPGA